MSISRRQFLLTLPAVTAGLLSPKFIDQAIAHVDATGEALLPTSLLPTGTLFALHTGDRYELNLGDPYDYPTDLEEDEADDWYRHQSPSARAYYYLENLDIGLHHAGQETLGCLEYIDGDCPGSSYYAVVAPDLVSLSLLQQRLNDLDVRLKIEVMEGD